jgi:putative hydrolase of the HAD superfamily
MLREDSGIKVFSFDVDGTLVSQEFADCVWLRGIPEAYAAKHALSFEHAFEFVKREYDNIGENRIEWYNIRFWLRKFNLKIPYEKLFEKYEAEVKIYTEVESVLKVLKEAGYVLVVNSNAATEFIDFQIQPIRKYFTHVFSATSFLNPRRIGITAYYLDRSRDAMHDENGNDEFVISDLNELLDAFELI